MSSSSFKISELSPLGRTPINQDRLVINDATNLSEQVTRYVNYRDLKAAIIDGIVNDPDSDGYLKPGDNITELNNNAGFTTEAWVNSQNYITIEDVTDGLDPDNPDGPSLGGFGFAPTFYTWPSSLNYSGDFSAWSGQITQLHGTSSATTMTMKMPKNADRALISFQYSASLRKRDIQGEPGYNLAQFGGGITISGATVEAGCGSQTTNICMGANMNQYTGITNSKQPGPNYTINYNPIKFSMLTFAEGGTMVSFTVSGTLQRAKKSVCSKSAGRMIVFPFNSKAIDTYNMQQMIDGFNSNNDYDITPDPLPDEGPAELAELLVEKMKYIVDVGRKIKDDPFFLDTTVSPATYVSGQDADGNDIITNTPHPGLTLDEIMELVYTIKRDSTDPSYTKDYQTVYDELADIQTSMFAMPDFGVSFPSIDPNGRTMYF